MRREIRGRHIWRKGGRPERLAGPETSEIVEMKKGATLSGMRLFYERGGDLGFFLTEFFDFFEDFVHAVGNDVSFLVDESVSGDEAFGELPKVSFFGLFWEDGGPREVFFFGPFFGGVFGLIGADVDHFDIGEGGDDVVVFLDHSGSGGDAGATPAGGEVEEVVVRGFGEFVFFKFSVLDGVENTADEVFADFLLAEEVPDVGGPCFSLAI